MTEVMNNVIIECPERLNMFHGVESEVEQGRGEALGDLVNVRLCHRVRLRLHGRRRAPRAAELRVQIVNW